MVTALRDILNNSDKIYEVKKQHLIVQTQITQEILMKMNQKKRLSQISSDMGADPPIKENVKEVFKYLDTDNSGKIEFTEFEVLI